MCTLHREEEQASSGTTCVLTLTLGTELAPVWAFFQLQLSGEKSQASEAACLLPLPSSVYLHLAEQFDQVDIHHGLRFTLPTWAAC